MLRALRSPSTAPASALGLLACLVFAPGCLANPRSGDTVDVSSIEVSGHTSSPSEVLSIQLYDHTANHWTEVAQVVGGTDAFTDNNGTVAYSFLYDLDTTTLEDYQKYWIDVKMSGWLITVDVYAKLRVLSVTNDYEPILHYDDDAEQCSYDPNASTIEKLETCARTKNWVKLYPANL